MMAFEDIEQPTTMVARCKLASRMEDEFGVLGTLVVDTLNDDSRAFFGDLPSPAILIDPKGKIHDKIPWADPELIEGSLNKLLNQWESTKASDPLVAMVRALDDGRLTEAARLLASKGFSTDKAQTSIYLKDAGKMPLDLRWWLCFQRWAKAVDAKASLSESAEAILGQVQAKRHMKPMEKAAYLQQLVVPEENKKLGKALRDALKANLPGSYVTSPTSKS